MVGSPIHRVVDGAECACNLAQSSRKDLDALSLGSPLDSCHKLRQRIEERGSRLRDPAADNDNFRVECINDGVDSGCEVHDRSQPNVAGGFIAS